ncbi:WLM domain-containing protein [Halenospora varia]|nr:WLM domain-containing protein [Halenospora varia]
MPLGWERINNKKSQPNKNIIFIKPLPGSTETTAKDFLERIAAQCLPIMNKNYLAVVSLEEYEPNLEFWGRNFNNGEVIQLVLRSPSTGRWLPFNFVQMVMMHELAHNKQMNHGPAFWKLRNAFATEMKDLWSKNYTGDGLWGRGVLLENGLFTQEELAENEILPEHMCGGTFKSRRNRNKRKAPKPKITWKEQQERRIKKKFGENGVALGADEETKVKLEKGKKPLGKPRVAGSARGRELRAAAALARFEVKKEEPQIKDDEMVTDSESESEGEDIYIKPEPDDAIDINGKRLLDTKGHGMVRICEDEDRDDENAKNELREMQSMAGQATISSSGQVVRPPASSTKSARAAELPKAATSKERPLSSIPEYKAPPAKSKPAKPLTTSKPPPQSTTSSTISTPKAAPKPSSPSLSTPSEISCPICTTLASSTSLTCSVCAHVLKPDFVPNTWHCRSEACKQGTYINAGDVGVCGVCGARKVSGGVYG